MRLLRTCCMRTAFVLLGGLMLNACSSDEETLPSVAGKGFVQLSLAADMGFEGKTKAVDEENYLTARPLADYQVKILDADGKVASGCEWTYSEVPEGLIELDNGSYKVVAYDGENFNETASTRDGIYMYGEELLDVNVDQVAKKSVKCTPACGKLVVNFGDDMATHFSEYKVHFSTKAASQDIVWGEADTDPLYVKLEKAGEPVKATFHFTNKKTGKKAEVQALTRDMKWGTMWTITVNPKVEAGILGITITFDDTVNDESIDIEIPSDWL